MCRLDWRFGFFLRLYSSVCCLIDALGARRLFRASGLRYCTDDRHRLRTTEQEYADRRYICESVGRSHAVESSPRLCWLGERTCTLTLNHATRALLHALELALFHLKISAIMLN